MAYRIIMLALLLWAGVLQAQETKGRFESSMQEFDEKDRKNPPAEGVILFTGSSSIKMWQDIDEYFPEHDVLNRGFGGSDFSDLLHYKDRVIFKYKPSKIFIYEGDNDIASGEDPKDILKEAKQLRKAIKKELPGVPVIFISAKPSVSRWHLKEQYKDLNKKLQKYAKRTKNTEYADVWTPALDENDEVMKDIFLKDNLHMNAKGYKIWQEVLMPFVEPY